MEKRHLSEYPLNSMMGTRESNIPKGFKTKEIICYEMHSRFVDGEIKKYEDISNSLVIEKSIYDKRVQKVDNLKHFTDYELIIQYPEFHKEFRLSCECGVYLDFRHHIVMKILSGDFD